MSNEKKPFERDIVTVMMALLCVVPESETDLRCSLEHDVRDLPYRAPETRWRYLHDTTYRHVRTPLGQLRTWEKYYFAILSTKNIDEIERGDADARERILTPKAEEN